MSLAKFIPLLEYTCRLRKVEARDECSKLKLKDKSFLYEIGTIEALSGGRPICSVKILNHQQLNFS